jgi:hypothetical protein
VLQEKKEVDSARKYATEVQYNAPPSLVDVIDLNKQLETYIFVSERVCLKVYICELVLVGLVAVKKSFHAVLIGKNNINISFQSIFT